MEKYLLMIATLDTKGREAAYVKDCVQALGIHPILMDVGTLAEPLTNPDITRSEVIEAAGSGLDSIQGKDRSIAVAAVQKGISLPTLQRLLGHDRLTTTEIYLNLSPEDVIREFREKW